MSSLSNNPSLGRSRSLRVPATTSFKPTASSQVSSGPSHISLFLTNLRLLNLDLRNDWPDITSLTFSTKDVQQNQKKRIQSVEWALFHLFTLWDPEETRNKLQPFFPPLEQLQSLNLRAALFRCLDQVKKIGVLGRDTVLRKTMLDECKGERLEEVLAVFSSVVLKKVLEGSSEIDRSIAKELALENFSYTGERTVLSALILAHKASLQRHLREKNDRRAHYQDFSELLKLNERRIVRRREQLKEVIGERSEGSQISPREVESIQNAAQSHWSGNEQWLDTILYGENRQSQDGLLATRFDRVWKHVESGRIGDIEGSNQAGLIDQLEARVKDQEDRLAKWKAFGRTLTKKGLSSPSKKAAAALSENPKINLGFNQHVSLQIGRQIHTEPVETVETVAASLDDYNRLIQNMRAELDAVKNPKESKTVKQRAIVPELAHSPTQAPAIEELETETEIKAEEDEWSSVSEAEEPSPGFTDYKKSVSQTPPSEAPTNDRPISVPNPDFELEKPQISTSYKLRKNNVPTYVYEETSPANEGLSSPSPIVRPNTPPQEPPKSTPPIDHEAQLADHILNSISTASPSPKKRHTLSLAERTRLSMSRTSHSQFSDLNDEFEIADLPRLPIKPRHSIAPKPEPSEPQAHADLIERTRKSMAGFEAAQKNAKIERRRSIRDEKKKQRQSSYFPRVEEEVGTPDASAIEALERDPDYESVFKSRPKIATSPAVSPTRIWEDERED